MIKVGIIGACEKGMETYFTLSTTNFIEPVLYNKSPIKFKYSVMIYDDTNIDYILKRKEYIIDMTDDLHIKDYCNHNNIIYINGNIIDVNPSYIINLKSFRN